MALLWNLGRSQIFRGFTILGIGLAGAAAGAAPAPQPQQPRPQPESTSQQPQQAPRARDIILVLDTSKSMVGEGGKGAQDIFGRVKEAAKNGFVDWCQAGDELVLITYAETVELRPTVLVNGPEDRARLKEEIDRVQANGEWTYTSAAVARALAEAERLDTIEATRPGGRHQKVVILMTDGINNPPPGIKAPINLYEVARQYNRPQWYVWQIQLGNRVDDMVNQALSGHVQTGTTLDPGAKDLKGSVERAKRTVAASDSVTSRAQPDTIPVPSHAPPPPPPRHGSWAYLIGILAVVIIAIVAVAMLASRKPKLAGEITFWKGGEESQSTKLEGLNKRTARLGNDSGADISFKGAHGATLTARRIDGDVLVVFQGDPGAPVRLKGKTDAAEVELYNNDELAFEGYTFRYRGSVRARPESKR